MKPAKRLQQSTLIYSALMIMIIGATVAFVSIFPLYQDLKENRQRNLLFALETRTLAIEEYLTRARDIARQIASRSAIRRSLAAYNQQEITLNQLQQFGTPILEDALKHSQEVGGISRLDPQGNLVLQVGLPIPQEFWTVPTAATDTAIYPIPITLNNESYLVVSARINNNQNQQVGTDIILFKLSALQAIIVDYIGLGKTGETIIGTIYQGKERLFFPLRENQKQEVNNLSSNSAINLAFNRAISQKSGIISPKELKDQPEIIAYTPISDSDWVLLIRINANELYAPIYRQINLIGGVLVVLILLGTGGMVLLLRPLTGKMLLQTDELEKVIEEKTEDLQQELRQRRQAEQALQQIREQLERRVEQRTAEVRQANIMLRQEIEERKIAERNLKHKNAEMRAIFSAIPDLFFRLDGQGNILDYQTVNTKDLYVPPEQFIGKTVREVLPSLVGEQIQSAITQVLQNKVLKTVEYTLPLSDKEAYYEARLVPFQNNQAIAMVRNISDRQRTEQALRNSEARYRSLTNDVLDSSAVGIFILDANFRVIWVNQALERFFGLRRAEIIGKDKRQLIREQIQTIFADPDTFAATVLATYDDNSYIENFECHILPQDNRQERWLEHWSQPISSGLYQGGRIEHYTDITDRQQFEKELAERAQELEQSNQELERFAYVASHDLQEPLRTIISFAQLLEEEYQDLLEGEGKEYLDFMVDSATRMKDLIQDLLAFSRVGTRGQALVPTEVEQVLQKVLENLHSAIAASGAAITHTPLPTVIADESQLIQLFQNLISNAMKFRSENPPEINISVQPQSEQWLFSVRDNGIGIEPQYGERIFTIFQRLHSRRHYEGTGIGLAICRKIVERHGGKIWVESNLGQGATFYFTLPKPALSSHSDRQTLLP